MVSLAWTSWPGIRLFKLTLIGSLVHFFFVATIIGVGFAVAATYDLFAILALAYDELPLFIIWGTAFWFLTVVSSIILFPLFFLDNKEKCVVWHLADMAYHVVRWSLFFGLLVTNDVMVVSCACSIELLLFGAALALGIVIGLPFLLYKLSIVCYRQCIKEVGMHV